MSCLASSFFVLTSHVQAGTKTILSASSDTVYYLDDDKVRHAFPNRSTYESWFGHDFSQVEKISDEELAKILLGTNVVMRSGKYLVKVPSSPKVYAIEPGGVLRHITSEGVLKKIYGEHWLLKLRDLPEVFFSNYQLGERIDFVHQVPDGAVVQLTKGETYFWKNNQILEPFESFSDVLANGYNKQDVLETDIDLFKKLKPIQGPNSQVFNLSLDVNISTATCHVDSLSAAVIFITRDDQLDSKESQVLQATIDHLGTSWPAATDGLSSLEVNPELFVFNDKDGFFITKDENGKAVFSFEEITLQFYENEPDKYDFIIIYNDFLEAQQNKEKASFRLVRNDFRGTNRIILDRNRFHGSHGRLKGIVNMNKINQYSVAGNSSLASLLNLLHHELLHQWGAAVTFIDDTGSRSRDLLSEDKVHWSRWVNWISPLGGWGWTKTQDLGSGQSLFVSERQNLLADEIIKLSDMDLYLMGLMPARYMNPIEYLVPEDSSSVSDEVVGRLESVSIKQIINSHGEIKCDII